MSAWYLFSALGFYPLEMGSPDYAIGSPLFTKATVHLENGRKLVVSAPDNSTRNVYVQGLKVNGKPYDRTSLPHDLLAGGADAGVRDGPRAVVVGHRGPTARRPPSRAGRSRRSRCATPREAVGASPARATRRM